jgi:type II secretory pathway pseudopilin PulG
MLTGKGARNSPLFFPDKRDEEKGMKRLLMARGGRSRRGFTLVELMVATGMLVVTIMSLLMVYTRVISLNELSRERSLALGAAQSHMEEIKNALRLAQDAGGADIQFAAVINQYHQQSFTVSPDINGIARIDSVSSDAFSEIYEITVSVGWRDTATLNLGTLFYRYRPL